MGATGVISGMRPIFNADSCRQPSPPFEPRAAQDRRVRLHVGGEPLAKFGIGRGHRKESCCGKSLFACEQSSAFLDTGSHPTATGRKVYVMNFDAGVSVVQAGGSEFKLLHTANFKDEGDATRHRSSVAISQGNLFLRTGTKLFALGK